jgi:hypothetical protein
MWVLETEAWVGVKSDLNVEDVGVLVCRAILKNFLKRLRGLTPEPVRTVV